MLDFLKVDLNNELIYAIKNGNINMVELSINKGVDIHADNNVALILASKYGHTNIVQELINNGADIHAQNEHALILASKYGHINIVQLLINNGADIHAQDDLALILASVRDYINIVQELINNGANWKLIKDNIIVIDMLKKETNDLIKKLTTSYLSLKQKAPKGIHKQLLLKTVYEASYFELCSDMLLQNKTGGYINSGLKGRDIPPLRLIALANLMKLEYSLRPLDLCNKIEKALYLML